MSKNYTNALKCIACVLIFIHHFYMQSPGIYQLLGFWMVSLFFFLSAYGLTVSLKKLPKFTQYAYKRIKTVIVPYIVINIISIALSSFEIPFFTTANPNVVYVVNPNIDDYILYISGIKMIDSVMWYINVLLLFYILIYFIVFIKNPLFKIVYIFIVTIIYMFTAKTLGLGFYTYTGILGFPIGVLFAYADLFKWLRDFNVYKKYVLGFVICMLIISVLAMIYIQDHYIPLPLFFPLSYTIIILNCIFIYEFGNHISFLRKYVPGFFYRLPTNWSYEFYLLHMKVLVLCNALLFTPPPWALIIIIILLSIIYSKKLLFIFKYI